LRSMYAVSHVEAAYPRREFDEISAF